MRREDERPTETSCGECCATVDVQPGCWMVEEERGGANQLCKCERCGALVFAIVGTEEYIQRTMIVAAQFVALQRGKMH